MQIVPNRTFLVCVATAASMVIASRRGLWIKLSPNQTDSNTPDCSATTAVSINSSTSVRPNSAPRLGRLMPHLTGSFRILVFPSTVRRTTETCQATLGLTLTREYRHRLECELCDTMSLKKRRTQAGGNPNAQRFSQLFR